MHFIIDFNDKICMGKGVVINLTFESFRCKTMGSCVYNETAEKKEASAVMLHKTLLVN